MVLVGAQLLVCVCVCVFRGTIKCCSYNGPYVYGACRTYVRGWFVPNGV